VFFGPDGELMSVKVRNIKMVRRFSEGMDQPYINPQVPMVFDLESDPQERYNLTYWRMDNGFILPMMIGLVVQYKLSTVEYPNIEPGSEFKGYHGPGHLVDAEKAKLGAKKLAGGPKPEMGEAPETPAEARGERPKAGAPS
jgi:hypothetical protein